MSIIPREFINLLISKIDLVELINHQVPLRKKSGNNYFARCPFHNEKSASFSVSHQKQFYYCFGCGAHGNAIDFVMQYDRLSFPEAIETLAKQTGMEVPHATQQKSQQTSILKLYEVSELITEHFYEQMRKSQRAISYLKKRGIDGRIAKEFKLGYAPNSFHFVSDQANKNSEKQKHFSEIGVIIKKTEGAYYDRFRDRIIFPIHDYRGRIIGFGGRIIDQGEPKYLNSPETPLFQKSHELYGLYHALKKNRRLKQILIVEGYMDVIALFQHGVTYAVATMGTATTAHHIQRMLRYTSELIFCFDGDEAGRTAAWRALQVLLPIMHDNLQVRFLFLPDGEDPDSLIQKEGRNNFENRISTAQSLSVFFLQKLSSECDMASLEGRARFAATALDHIKQIPASLFQAMLIEELAKRARIPVKELQLQLPFETQLQQLENLPKNKLITPIKLAIALLVQKPELAKILEQVPNVDLPGYAFLTNLVTLIQQLPNPSPALLLEYWRNQKERDFMAKMLNFDHMIPEEGIKNEFLGAIRQMRLLACDNEINKILAQGADRDLTSEEKTSLSQLINHKKTLTSDLIT